MKQLLLLLANGENKTFQGKDAENVYKALSNSRGASITAPVKLENGWTVTFVINNIISFSYK